jgi:cytosine/uracil/thiamine/allantoin permease
LAESVTIADKFLLRKDQTKLDQLYAAVDKALQNLASHLGIAAA